MIDTGQITPLSMCFWRKWQKEAHINSKTMVPESFATAKSENAQHAGTATAKRPLLHQPISQEDL